MRGSPATKGPSTLSLLPALIPGALVGAKLPVLLSYGVSREMLWTGKSYYGALLGGFIAMNLYKAAKGIHGRFGDRFVVPLCLGAAVGKTGCFFAGCCGGIAANLPFGVANRMGILAYPVQLYEAGFQALMAAMFLLLLWKRRWMGSHFILYILLYSFFRFNVEFVRTEPRVLAGLTVYQWMSILSVPVFTTILARRLKDATTGA